MTENNPISRPKAFFLNGGMGRIICAIPALEKYYNESNDKDFIIVIEGIQNILDAVKKRSSISDRHINELESLVDRSNQTVKKRVSVVDLP